MDADNLHIVCLFVIVMNDIQFDIGLLTFAIGLRVEAYLAKNTPGL